MLRKLKRLEKSDYAAFDQLDGSHPWQQAVEQGSVLYPVRIIEQGHVTYFNFKLAKEMGLIPEDHPHRMNSQLERAILETFNLRIVNEFDQERPKLPSNWRLKEKKYMATRYLQLQHSNKKGATSGDGRSIWNGTIQNARSTWDVSSRGTGVTRLAPGFVEANRPLQTGCTDFGYGCGLAELDELYATAVQSEIFHEQGIHTERSLCIIDQGNGCGIGVRAAKNLLRPAHLFLYLKQSRHAELKSATDYFIQRQYNNRHSNINPRDPKRYTKLARMLAQQYGKFAGRLEADYIFVWLDWDGDNVLLEPGIIDYGSVRQFGLHHNRYRYDDVDRYSTTLTEQKIKAFQITQTILQMCHYLETGKKLPVQKFARHPIMREFVQAYREEKIRRKLSIAGIRREEFEVLKKYPRLLDRWHKEVNWFEERKRKGPATAVADGVNAPALLDVKNLLKALPNFLVQSNSVTSISVQYCLKLMSTKYSQSKNLPPTQEMKRHLRNLILIHKSLIQKLTGKSESWRVIANRMNQRMKQSPTILTGDALIHCIGEMMESHRKNTKAGRAQNFIDLMVSNQRTKRSKLSGGPLLIQDANAWNEILQCIEKYKHHI